MKKVFFLLFGWLTIPHVFMYLLSRNKQIINKDVDRWAKCAQIKPIGGGNSFIINMMWLLLYIKQYRNVFYLRMDKKKWLLMYLPPLSTLYICTKSENFGAGTYIQHGFATVITAEKVGENCWINQQVTIGYNDSKKYGYGKPTIGNNVRVSAGAKVCGNITVGDGSVIGVNAVVVKNVPAKSVIVPSPMIMIQEEGVRVNKKF